MKCRNQLLGYNAIIYQNDEWFRFSLDSVLLAHFVTLNKRAKKIIDLATGNAPIPIMLSYRTNADIYGIELQKCVFELGVESVLENNLNDRIHLINGDVKEMKNYFTSDYFDVVVCNPPYFKIESDSIINDNVVKARARHELTLGMDDVLKNASFLLKNGGIFSMVHRTERFVEVLDKMRRYSLEPKRIQFIYPKSGKDSDLFLIEGIKNGSSGLKMLPPLVVHDENGNYTEEISSMFCV